MKLQDVLSALQQGKGIRRRSWKNSNLVIRIVPSNRADKIFPGFDPGAKLRFFGGTHDDETADASFVLIEALNANDWEFARETFTFKVTIQAEDEIDAINTLRDSQYNDPSIIKFTLEEK
jgi:hypothetical protein